MPQDLPTYTAPGHLLRRACQLHDRFFEEEFEGVVTPRQFALLIALARSPGVDQITLSNQIAVDRSTIGDMVSRLINNGFIARVRDEEDGRRKLLRLTPAGRKLVRTLLPRIDNVTQRLLEPLTDAERTLFVGVLEKLATAPDSAFPEYRSYAIAALNSGREA